MKAKGSRWSIPLLAVLLTLLVAGSAEAATVVNGDFESGDLQGWHVHRSMEAGNWFAYEGTDEPLSSRRGRSLPHAPPQGAFAAIADEVAPDTLILYQDIALPPGQSEKVSLLAYYDSARPIAVPSPDTLSVDGGVLGGQANQQYRIDVIRPDAPLESVEPGDILRTVFRTAPGAPERMGPTRFTADLSPFAGQTVRLRIAVAAHEELFTAGVDAVTVSNSPPGSSGVNASTRFKIVKIKANRKNGIVTLRVGVPGPGLLTAVGDPVSAPAAHASKARESGRPVRSTTVKAATAGTVKIRLRPTSLGRGILERKHELRVRVGLTFKPANEPSETTSLPVMLRLKAPSRR
jgi:hypothetical protein